MLAGIDWANLSVAGAFISGAVFATIAVLRVVRAVSAMFDPRRPPPRRPRGTPPDDDDAEDWRG